MNRKKRIKILLYNNFVDWEFEVIDNSLEHSGHHEFDGTEESHFVVTLKNKSRVREDRIKTHRKINNLLKEEFSTGLHAIEIKIL